MFIPESPDVPARIAKAMEAISALPAKWEKEAAAYKASFPIAPGSSPSEMTPAQQNAVNMVGILRHCAHDLKQALKL